MRIALDKLRPAPWNPRTIRDERFKNLCASIEADPGLLDLRPILATKDGTIYGGNMRYRAVAHLGWTDVPAILSDIPEQLAKERGMRDNGSWGEWKDDDLGALLAELKTAGTDLDLLGFESVERLLGTLTENDLAAEWQDMPAFEQGDLRPVKQVIVSFARLDDMEVFARLLGLRITPQTKSFWYPPRPEIDHDRAYVTAERLDAA